MDVKSLASHIAQAPANNISFQGNVAQVKLTNSAVNQVNQAPASKAKFDKQA